MSNKLAVQPVLARLDAVRNKIRALFLWDGLAVLALTICGFFVVTFMLDWLLNLPVAVRLIFLAGGIGLVLWTLYRRVIRPMAFPISDDDLAIIIERHYPHLADRLISAIQLARTPEGQYEHFNSPELVEHLVEEAVSAAQAIEFRDVIVHRHVVKLVGVSLALALGIGIFGIKSDLSSIYFKRLIGLNVAWPQRVHLTVEGFDNNLEKTIARGDLLMIKVLVEVDPGTSIPTKATLYYRFTETGEEGREYILYQGKNYYAYEFTRVNGPFTFHIEAGDAETEEHKVYTDTPPTVLKLNAYFTYPPYTRMQNTNPENPEPVGNIEAPLFTRVRIEGHVNEPLVHASVIITTGTTEEAIPTQAVVGSKMFTTEFVITHERSKYEIRLEAKNKLKNRDRLVYDIRGRRDQKPEILLTSPNPKAKEEFVTPICEYPIRFTISDDYGLKHDADGRPEILFQYRLSGQDPDSWVDVPLKYPNVKIVTTQDRNPEEVKGTYILFIKPLDLKPGDWITFRLVVTDNKTLGGANESTSRPYRFTITSIEELEKELERAVDRIKQQLTKQRIAATRNRERGRRHQQKLTDDTLTAEHRGEIRISQRNQMGITSRLRDERDHIRHVSDRGEYNKIFNEEAVRKLVLASGELDALASDDPTKDPPAVSRVAAQILTRAADALKRKEREEALETFVELEDEVIDGITRTLNLLERWETYQGVVRTFRTVVRLQEQVRRDIMKMLKMGNPDEDEDDE